MPILALIDKGRPGCLVCVHGDDLAAAVAEFTLANPELVERAIRRARPGTSGGPDPHSDEAA